LTYPDKNDDSTAKLYINGAVKNINQQSGTHIILSPTSLSAPSLSFSGLIDDVRIYNEVVPTSWVEEQYYAGLNRLLSVNSILKEGYFSRISQLAINN
ncbi:MAG: hypothetical protein PHH21_01130, partial [Candidatus Pacebacteria bacterium]|nr:hypothetical protein [Candidatus Paceibacterota bacterium]